jgi:hypothetical protein
MGRWRDTWWFGATVLVVVLAGYLYATHQGPFQQCVTTGSGSSFCGEAARAYCSESEPMSGHTIPCDKLLGDRARPAAAGAPPARAASATRSPGYAPAAAPAAAAAPASAGASGGGDCVAAISC